MLKRVPMVLDTERDADIVRWLEAQQNRSAAIREVIREAIRAKTRPQSTLDTAVLRRVLREELARLTVTSVGLDAGVASADEDREVAALLDAMF